MRLAAGSAALTQMAGSSAASHGSSTGTVSAAGATVAVSGGCAAGSARSMSASAHCTNAGGLQPASKVEPASTTAVPTMLAQPSNGRLSPLASVNGRKPIAELYAATYSWPMAQATASLRADVPEARPSAGGRRAIGRAAA